MKINMTGSQKIATFKTNTKYINVKWWMFQWKNWCLGCLWFGFKDEPNHDAKLSGPVYDSVSSDSSGKRRMMTRTITQAGWKNPQLFRWKERISITNVFIYLEPKWPLFLKVNPQNKALFNQNKGHLGSRYIYIYVHIWLFRHNYVLLMLYDLILIFIIIDVFLPAKFLFLGKFPMRFPMTLAQVDLRLIGQHVAWLPACAAAVVPTVPQVTPRDGQASRSATSARMANVPPSYLPCALGGNE